MPIRSDETSPTRWSLVKRLKDWDDQESWRDFFNTYWKLIYSAAMQSGLTDGEAQEVVQETVITVAKKMSSFQSRPRLRLVQGLAVASDQAPDRGPIEKAATPWPFQGQVVADG